MRFNPRDIQQKQTNAYELYRLVRILLKTAIKEKIKIRILHENAQNPSKLNLFNKFLSSVNLNSTDLFKKSLLHKAVESNNLKLVKLLLNKGVTVNIKDLFGNSPLSLAIKSNNFLMIKLLVKHGAYLNQINSNNVSLNFNGDRETFAPQLYENLIWSTHLLNDLLRSPLQLAILNKCSSRLIRFLLRKGADPNQVDKYGFSALHFASKESDVRVLKLLVKHGGNLNLRSHRNILPLNWSFLSNNIECTWYILHKTNPNLLNSKDYWGFTPMDRLWFKMNTLRFALCASDDVSIEKRAQTSKLVEAYQQILRSFVRHGCKMNKYFRNPHKFPNSFYVVSNLVVLLRSYLVLKKNYRIEFIEKLVIDCFKFITCKLLNKSDLIFELDNRVHNKEQYMYELGEFQREINSFRCLIYVLFTSGKLDWWTRLLVIQNIFSSHLILSYLNKSVSNRQNRINLFLHFYNYSLCFIKNPLKLQDYSRIVIRSSLKTFKIKKTSQLNLTRAMREFVFYE